MEPRPRYLRGVVNLCGTEATIDANTGTGLCPNTPNPLDIHVTIGVGQKLPALDCHRAGTNTCPMYTTYSTAAELIPEDFFQPH